MNLDVQDKITAAKIFNSIQMMKFFKVNLKARSSLLVILIKNNIETFSIKKKTLVIKDFMP